MGESLVGMLELEFFDLRLWLRYWSRGRSCDGVVC